MKCTFEELCHIKLETKRQSESFKTTNLPRENKKKRKFEEEYPEDQVTDEKMECKFRSLKALEEKLKSNLKKFVPNELRSSKYFFNFIIFHLIQV